MNSNKKVCAVAYTGGNSHLALIKAMEAGYTPSCLTFWESGLKHRSYFADISRIEILKKHAELLKIGFFLYKVRADFIPKNPFSQIRHCISKALNLYYANTLVMGYTGDTEYKKEVIVIKEACQSKSFKLLLPLLKLNTEDLIEEYVRYGLKMLIVSIDKKIPLSWLGKMADEKFVNFIRKSRRDGIYMSKPDFQILVVKSPLIKKEMKIHSSEIISDKNGYYLDIRKFAF